MPDPHVESLSYRLEVGDTLAFNNPPPLDHETDHFSLRLENDKLTVRMKEHHPASSSARGRVEPLLRSWELSAALLYGPGALRFVFDGSDLVDRDGKATILEIEPMTLTITGMPVRLTVGRVTYIPPPTDFTASPDVVTLWDRFQGYREGREPLAAMAYFCLTLLKARGNGIAGAAALYNVHPPVLRKLSELTSVRGDEATGRKFRNNLQPLTPQEAHWVEEVVRRLIRRVGEQAAGSPVRQIVLADFPPLK